VVKDALESASPAAAVREGSVSLRRTYDAFVRDIDQLKELIDDATSGLSTNFAAVAEMARTMARLAETGPARDAECGGSFARGIGQQMQSAAIHLQFHDLASQVLASMRDRLNALVSATSEGSQSCSEKSVLLHALEERRPTDLQVRAGGDVELF